MDGVPAGLVLAMLALGLASGLHCVGMCGGIVTAFASGPRTAVLHDARDSSDWPRHLAFNGGRIASYAAAGAIAGAIGAAGAAMGELLHAQLALYVVANVMLVVVGLHLLGIGAPLARIEALGAPLWRRIAPHAGRLAAAHSLPAALGAGAVWGWLPCGMVYAVLLAAMSSADPLEGALIMLAFGAGTLPNVMGVMLFYRRLAGWLQRPLIRYAAAAVVSGLGVTILVGGAVPAAFSGESLFCRLVPSFAATAPFTP